MARKLVNGVELEISEAGTGPSLLLVHGFTGAAEDFSDHFDDLAARWRTVSFDHRGHGASGRAPEYPTTLMAADVVALVQDLGLAPALLVGHSMGGFVAQEVALARPDLLRGLVLMDTGAGAVQLDDELRALVAAAATVARTEGMAALLSLMKQYPEPLDTPANQRLKRERPGYEEWCDRKFLATDPEAYAQLVEQFLTQDDRLTGLAAVTLPTLVMVGEEDRPFLRTSREMAATIPGARLEVIPDAGHSPQVENPVHWQRVLSEFARSASVAGSGD